MERERKMVVGEPYSTKEEAEALTRSWIRGMQSKSRRREMLKEERENVLER